MQSRRDFVIGAGSVASLTLLGGCGTGYGDPANTAAGTSVAQEPWDIEHVLITGQSLSTGEDARPILSFTQPFSNIMFSIGGDNDVPGVNARTLNNHGLVFSPLEATQTGNPTASNYETLGNGFGDSVIAATATTAVQYPAIRAPKAMLISGSGIPGYVYTQLCGPTDYTSDPVNGSPSFQEMMSQVKTGLALAKAAGKSYTVPCVVIVHGEFDAYNPAYLQDLVHWQSDCQKGIQAITGQTATIPFLLTQCCPGQMLPGTSPTAQLQAATQHPDKFILAGPEYQIPHWLPGQLGLTIHLPAKGQRMLGAMVYRAFRKVFLEGGTWVPLMPTAVTCTGNKVVIDYAVPVQPIVLDTTWCSDPGNYGFYYTDAGGAAITQVAVTGLTQITLTLNKTSVSLNRYVAYAFPDLDPGFGPTNGTRGCLRDSSNDAGHYDAVDGVPSQNYSVRWGGSY
jgi:hypothetical protein